VKVVAADSSSAILNDKFEPQTIVATAAVLVDPPYREARKVLSKPIYADANKGHEVIIHEAELCLNLLEKTKADVVHLDISLGAIPLEQLSPIQFTNMKISTTAKQHLLKILPRIRKTAGEITRKHGIDVLAIGKESIPVRVAELTSGAHATLYACEKALEEKRPILLGLPSKCQPIISGENVQLDSLIAAEHDVRGFAVDQSGVLKKVDVTEMLNPIARGFRTLRIEPRT